MPDASTLTLPDGRPLRLVQASNADKPADWATALALGQLGPLGALVVLAGGDDPVDEALRPRLAQLLSRGLLRTLRDVAAQRGGTARALCVVRACGSGLPDLLGRAVADSDGAVALLGVAPAALLALPGAAADGGGSGESPVPGLSQLLATPGAAWGDELRAKVDLVQALADARPAGGGAGTAGTADKAPTALRPLLLVIGGGAGSFAEVRQAVSRHWPVLLVEGSGGMADALARQFKAGEADNGDPHVTDILADGHLGCITLGDKAAGAVAALAAALQRECGGASVLRLAWQTFGALDRAAMQQQKDFGKVQGWVLVLGLVVVAMSVAHSLGKANGWGWTGDSLHYALIVAPICVSALIAVGNRFSPAKRWVLLRAAAEALKREIYRYRVRPSQALADGVADKRLQQSMEDITRRLARTEVNSMANPLYVGDIPPANAVAKGDDGISLLGTDRYVRLRLADQLAYYGNKTTRLERQASGWQMVAIVVGALGTLLAALGGDWVNWVALTSALASAALAYIGYKQFETTLTSYNQTAADLNNLLGWWTALLPDEQAQPDNVDKLVTTTEKVLADEQDGWAQNMTNALAALRTGQDDKPKNPPDVPDTPVTPAAPEAPVEPVVPDAPAAPGVPPAVVDPVDPADPADPAEPVDPVGPVDPTAASTEAGAEPPAAPPGR